MILYDFVMMALLTAECLVQQDTIEREFLQKAFSRKSLIVVRRNSDTNHFIGGFRWICIIGTLLPKILESSLKGNKRMRIVRHDWPVPRLSLLQQNSCFRGKEKDGLNTVDGCAESAEDFNMPQCHELL